MATKSLSEAVEDVVSVFGENMKLKQEQRQILQCLVDKKDCVAVLPTGFGKSLPFQLFIPVQRLLGQASNENSKMIVVCPLISLMQDQVEKLSDVSNVTAAYVGSSPEDESKIRNGAIDLIYGSPEAFVGDSVWRANIQKLNLSAIVVDEFHTIATWGDDDDGIQKQAFRKWFASVGELRSSLPSATVLALRATCTVKIKKKRVMNVLQMKDDTIEIIKSPNNSLFIAHVHTGVEILM